LEFPADARADSNGISLHIITPQNGRIPRGFVPYDIHYSPLHVEAICALV